MNDKNICKLTGVIRFGVISQAHNYPELGQGCTKWEQEELSGQGNICVDMKLA